MFLLTSCKTAPGFNFPTLVPSTLITLSLTIAEILSNLSLSSSEIEFQFTNSIAKSFLFVFAILGI